MKKSGKPKVPPIFLINLILRVSNFLGRLKKKLLPPQLIFVHHSMVDIVVHRCLYIAAELRIADLLKDGPKSIEQLAEETGTNTDALYRVLRALSSSGIFIEKKNKYFETNRVGKNLQSDDKDTMLYWVKLADSEWAQNAWGDLLQTVKNGKSYYENKHGMNFFNWLEKNPVAQKTFDVGVTSISTQSDVPISAAYDFSPFKTIIDVGGGRGSQLISILKAYPEVKGTLFELSFPIGTVANEGVFEKAGVADRTELIDGDFFESVPAGYDAYFMKSILHDWDDEKAVKILSNCRKAMRKDSTFIIVENVVNDEYNTTDICKYLDINVLILMAGRVRTISENRQILEKAGFELKRIIPTASIFTILEAKPV